MNRNLILFLTICFLALGSVIVYSVSTNKPDKEENKSQVLSGFDNTNKTNPEELTTPTMNNQREVKELKIEDITVGTGSAVEKGNTAEVNYLGTFLDGRKFDSSYDRGQTFSFEVGAGNVIQGWDLGLIGMQVGGERKLTIPSSLAYGERGAPGAIPPNTPLMFEIELISIK